MTGFESFGWRAEGQPAKAGLQPKRSVVIAVFLAASGSLLSGCGNQYRPVVSAISPVGPAAQPTKYAIAVSNTTPLGSKNQTPGLLTFVDVSGDTVLSTPSILPYPAPLGQINPNLAPTPSFVNPLNVTTSNTGSQGFLVNQDGLFESFPTGNPTTLLTQNIVQESLAANSVPAGVQSVVMPSIGQTLFIPQTGGSSASGSIAELQVGSGASLIQNLAVQNPVYTVGTDNAARAYAISANGFVRPIESNPVSLDPAITVGTNPVYGIMTTDGNRAFILNKGDGTVTVINVPSNALDAGVPSGTITLPSLNTGGSAAPNPVWADLLPASYAEMVVLNQGDGVHPGSLTTISIPLCNQQTPSNNPNSSCNPANPNDANGFGTIVNTVTVGVNPTMVSVLQDPNELRAYVVNQGILPTAANTTGVEGSISVVDLLSQTVVATINGKSVPADIAALNNAAGSSGTAPNFVFGHPNTVVAVSGTPTGKVYTTSTDSQYLTVLETDIDSIITHINLQGTGIRVVATAK